MFYKDIICISQEINVLSTCFYKEFEVERTGKTFSHFLENRNGTVSVLVEKFNFSTRHARSEAKASTECFFYGQLRMACSANVVLPPLLPCRSIKKNQYKKLPPVRRRSSRNVDKSAITELVSRALCATCFQRSARIAQHKC